MIVDLNNFSTFPTLAVGILVASLRNAGHDAEVLCPLAHGVIAAVRERRESYVDHLKRMLRLTTHPYLRPLRDVTNEGRRWWRDKPNARVIAETRRALDRRPDVVLLSAYMQHHATVVAIGKEAQKRGIPMILGGPMFNIKGSAEAWCRTPGLAAVFGGEADIVLPQLVERVCEREDLLSIPGVMLPTAESNLPAPPLADLDQIPIPDFSDFPWDRYRHRIVPLMTGRGCQWNRCAFCSDIVSASGRTFRTRSLESVLVEMREQSRRHHTTSFNFLDLKLNSYPKLLRGMAENVQRYVPGAEWIGAVHVDLRRDNGLSQRDLRALARAGMRRVSFGLETGSQRLYDLFDKGSRIDAASAFIRYAHEAGLSVRCTMFTGFPGEGAEDLKTTAAFLRDHTPYIDRVRFNPFTLFADTAIFDRLNQADDNETPIRVGRFNYRRSFIEPINRDTERVAYRNAKFETLRAIYAINRREVRLGARAFDGLM